MGDLLTTVIEERDGLKAYAKSIEERCAALESEVADLRKDRERLAYLQGAAAKRGCGWSVDGRGEPYRKHFSQEPEFETLQEAIDAAMSTTDEDQKEGK